MAARYWPSRQRVVVLTFPDAEAATRFDRWAATIGSRNAAATMLRAQQVDAHAFSEMTGAAMLEVLDTFIE